MDGDTEVAPDVLHTSAALAALLRRRLEQAAKDETDLLRCFELGEPPGSVSASALLLDRGFRRAAFQACAADSATSCFAAIVQAAKIAEGVELFELPRAVLRLSSTLSIAQPMASALPPVSRTPPSSPLASSAAEHVVTCDVGRNFKSELQAFLCKHLGRPACKTDLVFAAKILQEKPPLFEASVELLGRTFASASPRPNKKAAEQLAAAAALAELSSERPGLTAGVDYKGLLMTRLQTRREATAKDINFELVQGQYPEEKTFQVRVVLPISLGPVGGKDVDDASSRSFVGSPRSRCDYASSAQARQAAQQSAARKALEALDAEDKGEANRQQQSGSRSLERAQILWLPSDSSCLPSLKFLDIKHGDFLAAAAGALKCENAVPTPLLWSGNRPKGLCLYEYYSDHILSPPAQRNERASRLLGSDSVTVYGDVVLLDAAAHSKGLALANFSYGRYEVLKADRCGLLSNPIVALNASRAMLIGGDIELPFAYEPSRWVGLNPRTLLHEILHRYGVPSVPCFTAIPDAGAKGYRFHVLWEETDSVKKPTGCGNVAHVGVAHSLKADAQQDAAFEALRAIASSACLASEAEHPLAKTWLPSLRHKSHVLRSASADDFIELVLDYSISVVREQDESIAEAGLLVLESHEQLRVTIGAGVLHPALERLALTAELCERLMLCGDCDFEGVSTQARLDLLVRERIEPPAKAIDSKVVHFQPPLRQQRVELIVNILKSNTVSSAVDLGCGDGRLLEALLLQGLQRVVGVESSGSRAMLARKRLRRACSPGQAAEVLLADLLRPDGRWSGLDAVVLSEVIEHLPVKQLSMVAHAIFGIGAKVVVVSTPNADFNFGQESDSTQEQRALRHPDHEFEWTREEFRRWAEDAAESSGKYIVSEETGVGFASDDTLVCPGPCTQVIVFLRTAPGDEDARIESNVVPLEEVVDVERIPQAALRQEELAPSDTLRKFVMREGCGEIPPLHSRVVLHHATYLVSGCRVSASREGKRSEPCAFQLGGGHALEAWQRASLSMRRGEAAWVRSDPQHAFGEFGCPPRIPARALLWFFLELVDFKLPGTVRFSKDPSSAVEEGERQRDIGREAIGRQAFAQARQAFRRALDAVPEKLMLGASPELIARYAAIGRSSLLNQAICGLRLGVAAKTQEDPKQTALFEDVVRVCTLLLEHHLDKDAPDIANSSWEAADSVSCCVATPQTLPELHTAVKALSSSTSVTAWVAKAYFRRATALEHLSKITDAISDFERALRLQPSDAEIRRQLDVARERQRKVELQPSKMFASILERERSEREREEAAAALEEKKRRREARLRQQAAATMCGD